jgi:hypothetical protein
MAVTVKPRAHDVSLDRPDRLAPGTRVEVRTRFDGHWARGFAVASVTDDGYRVTRESDGRELPTEFSHQDVRLRKERKRGTWWY